MSFTAVFKELAALLSLSSKYFLLAAAFGAAAAFVADLYDRNRPLYFVFATTIAVAPIHFWASSDRRLRSKLEEYKALLEAKMITPKQHAKMRETLLRWYLVRQFGRAGFEFPKDDEPDPPKPPTPPPP